MDIFFFFQARDVYEEAIQTVMTVRDFGQVLHIIPTCSFLSTALLSSCFHFIVPPLKCVGDSDLYCRLNLMFHSSLTTYTWIFVECFGENSQRVVFDLIPHNGLMTYEIDF